MRIGPRWCTFYPKPNLPESLVEGKNENMYLGSFKGLAYNSIVPLIKNIRIYNRMIEATLNIHFFVIRFYFLNSSFI